MRSSLPAGCPLSITVNLRHSVNVFALSSVCTGMLLMALVTFLVALGIVPATLAIGR